MAHIQFVDENDNPIGGGTKQNALENSIRHRIARIFLFNSKGEILIQKRAEHLASGPGKWDQSAAGHVDEGEAYEEAARREMKEEIGVEDVSLTEAGSFYREEKTKKGGVRKRFNRVYQGNYDGEVHFNPDEVSEVRWIVLAELEKWMSECPEDFTEGCIHAYRQYVKSVV